MLRSGHRGFFLPLLVPYSFLALFLPSYSGVGCPWAEIPWRVSVAPPWSTSYYSGLGGPLFFFFLAFTDLPYTCIPRGTTISAVGLTHTLWWVSWSWLEPAMSSMGQARPLLTEAAMQHPPPAPRHLYPMHLPNFPGFRIPITNFQGVFYRNIHLYRNVY